MNVVVSAIVDPWVTTLSFVVALAMKIQGQNLQILCRNQARARRALVSRRTRTERATWRETLSTSSAFAQETRHPHEMDAGLKSLATSAAPYLYS